MARSYTVAVEVVQGFATPSEAEPTPDGRDGEFSHPEIVDIMGLPTGTVKTRVLRGRRKPRELPSDCQEGSSDE